MENVKKQEDPGMSDRRVRVALIGAGHMANSVHYPSLAEFEDVELAAICDLIEEKARATAERFRIPRVYTDYRRMIDEVEPEAVYVIMPPQHLFEPVVHCLRLGRHVFIEKPPAVTTFQTKALAYYAEEYRCITMVGFQRRHIPALTALKQRVEARGPIQQAAVSFLKSTRDLTQPAFVYGGVIDQLTVDGIHAVDNLRFLCGGEVVDVVSDIRTRYVPGPFPNAFTALITFSTGAVGILQSNYTTGRRIFRAEFHGRNITAYVDADREAYIVADDGEPERYDPRDFFPRRERHHYLGFYHENRHFIDCVKEGRQPTSNFADAVKTMELVDRIYQARMKA